MFYKVGLTITPSPKLPSEWTPMFYKKGQSYQSQMHNLSANNILYDF